jgi:predicted TIM-barrel fold metal-dependent hydrolase
MMIVDAHTHILPPELIARREECCSLDRWFGSLYADPEARLASADDLLTSMGRAGIDRSISFGFAFSDNGLCHHCNEYVLDMANKNPALIPFIVVNPAAGEVAYREARDGLERGAMGIGELMPDGQGFAVDDLTLFAPLMELARTYNAALMLHVNEPVGHDYRGKGRYGPQAAYRLASHYPQNRIILAHWGGGLPFYELMPEVRSTLGNLYYDTAASFFLYEEAIFRHVIAWAPHKVLFGTDYPLVGQKRFLQRVRNCGLMPEALEAVLGGNVLSVLESRKGEI